MSIRLLSLTDIELGCLPTLATGGEISKDVSKEGPLFSYPDLAIVHHRHGMRGGHVFRHYQLFQHYRGFAICLPVCAYGSGRVGYS